MELTLILLFIILSIGVSLGVGSSTLAITNFFVAIADGTIDETERNMMGIVYIVLRVAMGIILLSLLALTIIAEMTHVVDVPHVFILSSWSLVGVLYSNAFLMTKHIMPSTIGPALQASSWYTLGVSMTLFSFGLANYKMLNFYLSYFVVILLAASLVNGMMAYLKHKRVHG